jgi:hypothetical protein
VVNVELKCATRTIAHQQGSSRTPGVTVTPLDRGVRFSFSAVCTGAAIYDIHGRLVWRFSGRDFTEIVWDRAGKKNITGYYVINVPQGNRVLTKGFVIAK